METRRAIITENKGIREIEEHKHSETGHNYWHPVTRIHTEEPTPILVGKNNILRQGEIIYAEPDKKTYVCISCEKPCVQKFNTIPYGCLSHHKHKNSQWKETNIVISHSKS